MIDRSTDRKSSFDTVIYYYALICYFGMSLNFLTQKLLFINNDEHLLIESLHI